MSILSDMEQVRNVSLAEHPAAQGRSFELIVDFEGDDMAQTVLLTRLIQAGLPVTGYQETQVELEDVFMQVTKGIVS